MTEPSRDWSATGITDPTYRQKFFDVPKILADWCGPLAGLNILDFGCGEATMAISLALHYPDSRVTGVDVMPDLDRCLPLARSQIGLQSLPSNLALHRIRPGELPDPSARFDLIYSWSVMEHVDQPMLPKVLRQLHDVLNPGRRMLVQIQPLYYSSDGGHLMFKIPEPWGHLIRQDSSYIGKLRAACGSDNEFRGLLAMYRTLNRVTAPGLMRLAREAGFSLLREYTTREEREPPRDLLEAYQEAALRTDQVVLLLSR
jgi:SAM-dependent methyltransferase